MGTVELRKKWIQSIAIVDEQFLRLVDDLYKAYKNKPDFFDELPNEIQDLLIESREDIKNGNFFTHEEVMKSIRKKIRYSKISFMKIIWSKKAKASYNDELEFILKKWNLKEVNKFILLVDEYIEKLKTKTIEGKVSQKTDIRSIVISKQTTLFFDVNTHENRIELLLFWNNKKDPKELYKLLSK